jgi:OPT family oligopeptide transporter
MPFYEPLIAVLFALLVSVLAVRALGETDLNPVSGVGKVSQIVFAIVAPGKLVSNLIAGGIAGTIFFSIFITLLEAGAQQAGDMMQDLKTGDLLRASPRAQFYGQLIGSLVSVFVSVAAYELYTHAYDIPGDKFQVPTAGVWVDMAKLVNGGTLAHNVIGFCIAGAILSAAIPILENLFPKSSKIHKYMPSGIAAAVAMYVTPNWTIARVIGSLAEYVSTLYYTIVDRCRYGFAIILAVTSST